jgi:hypothetical protein
MTARPTEQVTLASCVKLRTLATSILPDVAAGSLSALVTLSYAISYGVLIFSGPELRPYVGLGVHSALMAAWVVALVVALGSSFRYAVADPTPMRQPFWHSWLPVWPPLWRSAPPASISPPRR